MSKEEGKNETRKLPGGEIVYLLKEPGANWQIRSYECRQNVRFNNAAGGFFFEWLQGLPKDWKDQEFDSVDSAIEFVKQQIEEEKVPRNNPQ
ncbi:MAG: hypothetical protein ACFFDI_30370 [Promethearchaeota archaeon]